MKIFKLLSLMLLTISLIACGGGGGSPGSIGSGSDPTAPSVGVVTPPAEVPGSVDVETSANELLSSGAEITVTAVIKSATNVGMADQNVTFEVDNRATLKGVSAKTDVNGVATARLSAGAKDLRNVTVTVKAGAATGLITLPVVGTRLSLTGPSSLKIGETAEFTLRVVDSADAPIRDVTLSAGSALSNALTSVPVTDGAGQAKIFYTANSAGPTGRDIFTVSGHGTASQIPIAISSEDFVYLTPSANTNVEVNTPQTIQVQYKVGGVNQEGVAVQFSTTRGLLSAETLTNASGIATVQLESSSAGPANVLARISSSQISLPLRFIAVDPASLVLQVNPGAVLPNTAGGSANQVTLDATVQDDSGNPVANQLVNFTIDSDDGNGGSLSSPSALTDINGRAQVQFIPGSKSTKKDGVVLRAVVGSTAIIGTAAITVNGQALNISIGFGNTIGNIDDTSYIKAFSVYVTDATGTPVANQLVNLSTSPFEYLKGTLAWNGVLWAYTPGVITCPNEDVDRDGELDTNPEEDTDGNGTLTPGNPIVVSPGTVRTDGAGRATFSLSYGEQYAPWLSVDLTARAAVGGTESSSSLKYFVNGLASDFSNETVAPAGQRSPFGTTLSCTSP